VTGRSSDPVRVGIIGMGYVGLTLAAAMADKGFEIHGVEVQEKVLASLRAGRPHIFEPGVADVFSRLVGSKIFVDDRLPPGGVDAAVICVSTPVDLETHVPYVANLEVAARHIADVCSPDTLVVVRSTVPVGTTREVVLPPLLEAWGSALLVMAPERTIQGQALRELVELPQVVGGLDAPSLQRGVEFFGGLARQIVPVSSLETAELVKLTNNCHTDVIYAFGNEVAMLTERLGLDPLEVIRATNLDYPRPDIARPGYVGGGCLSKDPYIMIAGAAGSGHTPELIRSARTLNEELPAHVARRVVDLMTQTGGSRLAVLGWAYKGWPPTDDMRGTPIATMMPIFEAAGIEVLGHDPLVTGDVIHAYGGQPADVRTAFSTADAVLIITDHPEYRALDVTTLLAASPVRVLFDSWRILDAAGVRERGVRYAGLGYEPTAAERAYARGTS
jgi:UDP-N-acetyl-D-mannosaminuronic acid dehydrogenase